MSLQQLQDIIDRSLERASPFTRRLFVEDHWDAHRIQEFVNRLGQATVATVRADGRPHAGWTLAACDDGTICFAAAAESLMARNLARRPDVALTVTDAEHGVMLQGRVRLLGRATEVPDVLQRLHAAIARGRFTPPDWDGYIFAVDLDRIFAS